MVIKLDNDLVVTLGDAAEKRESGNRIAASQFIGGLEDILTFSDA